MISIDASNKKVVFVGSAKPTPPPRFPRFILTIQHGADKEDVVSKVEALPAIKNVQLLKLVSIIFVDFESENISKDEARSLLQNIKGVGSIEEE